MPVYNTIELVGISEESWGAAAHEALREAAKTIRGIQRMEVLGTSCSVRDERIVEFRASVRISFRIEGAP